MNKITGRTGRVSQEGDCVIADMMGWPQQMRKPIKRDLKRRYRIVVSLPSEDLAKHGPLDFTLTSDEGDMVGSAWHGDLLDLQTVLVDRRIRRATFAIIDITKNRVGTPTHIEVMELDDLVDEAEAESEELA